MARLGKRLYNDELKLVEEDDGGRKRYQIYGFEPSFEDEEGTDLVAIAQGRVAVTADPLRPHRPRGARAAAGLGPGGDARRALAELSASGERTPPSAPPSSAKSSSTTTAATTSKTTRRSPTPTTTRC